MIFQRLVSAGVFITTPIITHPRWTGGGIFGGGSGGIFIPAPTINLPSGGLWRRLLCRLLCWRLRRRLRGLLSRLGTRHRGRLWGGHMGRPRGWFRRCHRRRQRRRHWRWHRCRYWRRHWRRLSGGMFVTTPTITVPNRTASGELSWMTVIFPATTL